jgi:hypothetical protein
MENVDATSIINPKSLVTTDYIHPSLNDDKLWVMTRTSAYEKVAKNRSGEKVLNNALLVD